MLLTEQDDARLIRDTLDGDLNSFDLLVGRYSAQVYRVALRVLNNREDAEDVQQETFVCAYRSLSKYRGDASFRTWLYSITIRICQSRLRRLIRRRSKVEFVQIYDADMDVMADPKDQMLAQEEWTVASEVLGRMSQSDRTLIVLRFIEGLGHDEIAEVLGCSVESSRARLSRAKKLFRELYERMGDLH